MSRLRAIVPAGKLSALSPKALIAGFAAGALALAVVAAGPLAPASAVDATVSNETELAAAFAAAAGSGTSHITLGASITAAGQSVPVNPSTVLDLAGHDLTLTGAGGHAGLQVPEGANLSISGAGHLTAIGGGNAAGIGASDDGKVGSISIFQATVTAKGGDYGAGIGAANGGLGPAVRITSGDVTATGGMSAAGIGGAGSVSQNNSGMGGSIEIGGGTVTATGGFAGAGIGNGIGGNADNNGTVVIDGGIVHATGGDQGTGIGGGGWSTSGTVTINDGDVTAQGSSGGAGIGAGYNRGGSGDGVHIAGGTVHATGGNDGGAGIGGGLINPSGVPVTIDAGNVTAIGGATGGSGIGSGKNTTGSPVYAPSGDITIGGADVTASAPGHIAIGAATTSTVPYTLKNAGRLTIPTGNTLQLPPGSTMDNSGIVTTDGEIANGGKISNTGRLEGAGGVTNPGVILNTGVIDAGFTVSGPNLWPVTFDLDYAGAPGVPLQVFAAKLGDGPVPDDVWAAEWPGHTLQGWYDAPDGGTAWTQDTAIAEATTLYARWTLDQETITFDAAGGSDVDPVTVDYGTVVPEPADPTRTGYTFDGWFTDADGGTTWDFEAAVTANTTIHAHWTINRETVTFDSAGGSVVDPVTVDYGTVVPKPADPTRTGYTFDGWFTDADGGTAWDFGTTVTADTTVHARWTAIEVAPTDGTETTGTTTTAPGDPGTDGTGTDGPATAGSGTTPAPDGGGLVRTGAEVGWPLWAAIALLGAGLASMAWMVRRRSLGGRHH